jgi:hypothetical protein
MPCACWIAALAPSLKILRPAHSASDADPALLAKVAQAPPQARGGKLPYKVEKGRRAGAGRSPEIERANVAIFADSDMLRLETYRRLEP